MLRSYKVTPTKKRETFTWIGSDGGGTVSAWLDRWRCNRSCSLGLTASWCSHMPILITSLQMVCFQNLDALETTHITPNCLLNMLHKTHGSRLKGNRRRLSQRSARLDAHRLGYCVSLQVGFLFKVCVVRFGNSSSSLFWQKLNCRKLCNWQVRTNVCVSL